MVTAAMKRIGQLGGYRFLDAYNSAIFQKTAAQKVIYVDSNTGTDSATRSGEDIRSPFATIDYAYNKATASQGDTILVLPFHAETVTAAITLDTAGVSVIGLSQGYYRPTITGNGAIDAVTITGAKNEFGGINFAGPSTDAQTAQINVAGANAWVHDISMLGSVGTQNCVDMITVTADGDDALIENVRAYNTVVECPSCIKLEGAATNVEIRNCFIWDSIGFTNGAIYDAAIATGCYIHHNVFTNAKADTVVVNFVAHSTGVTAYNCINGRNTTIQSNCVTGNSMVFFENYGVEEAKKSGLLMPVVDAE